MKNLEFVSKYPEIFTALSKWKTLELKDLYKVSDFNKSYDYFRKIITNMQKQKLLDATFFGSMGRSKVIYSNREVMKSLDKNLDYQINYATILHDAIVAKSLLALKKQGYVENFKLPHEYYLVENFCVDLTRVEPDAIFYDASGTVYLLEVELSQKDFSRYKRKWSQLSLNLERFYVIYLVPTLSVEKSLKKNIDRFCSAINVDSATQNKIRKRIIVVKLDNLITLKGFNELGSKMDFLKKEDEC